MRSPHPGRDPVADPVAGLLAGLVDGGVTPIARMIAAAWREALVAVADGASTEQGRAAVAALLVDETALPDTAPFPDGPVR